MLGFKKKEGKKVKTESFMQGVMALMFSQVLIKFLGLAYKWYLTNREGFGDEGNAIYSAGFSIYALLLTISSTGVPNAVARLVAGHTAKGDYRGAHRIFKIAFGTFACIGLIGTLIMFFGAGYIANVWLAIPEAELTLVALSPAIFFVSIICVFRGYFSGRENLKATANSQTIEQLFKTILTIVVVEIVAICSGVNTNLMAAGANLATTLSIILTFTYLYVFYKKNINSLLCGKLQVKCKKERVYNILKQILCVSIPISLTAILTSLNKNVDSVTVIRILKNFLEEEEAIKQYGILSGKVDTIITLPMSLNVAFATALVPAISSAKAINDTKTIQNKISFSLLITILIGLPCTVGLCIFSNEILNLLFPNASSGGELLALSSITVLFVVITQTLNGALQGLGKVNVPLFAAGIGLVIKIILNIVLISIPQLGINGAVIASIVNNIIVCLIEFVVLKKLINIKLNFSKYILKPFLVTSFMGVSSYYIYKFFINYFSFKVSFILVLLIAIIIYGIFIMFFKIFSKEELLSLPYGNNILKMLETIGICKKKHC